MKEKKAKSLTTSSFIDYPMKKEYIDAAHKEAEKKLDETIKKLSTKDKGKVLIIEQAVQLLKDNNIIFYLFPYLPSPNNLEEHSLWEWNSIRLNEDYNDDGNFTDEYKKLLIDINTNLQSIIYIFLSSKCKTFQEYVDLLIWSCEYTKKRLEEEK